jgi:hypothetical protein
MNDNDEMKSRGTGTQRRGEQAQVHIATIQVRTLTIEG